MSDPLASPAPCGPLSPRDGDEYREYFIPAFNASEEQKLLQDYAQDRLTHALRAILTDFYLLIELMRGYAQSRDEADFTYFLLAEKLRQPLDRLSNACSATVEWKLISRKTVGGQAYACRTQLHKDSPAGRYAFCQTGAHHPVGVFICGLSGFFAVNEHSP